jgi:hypothetical protein
MAAPPIDLLDPDQEWVFPETQNTRRRSEPSPMTSNDAIPAGPTAGGAPASNPVPAANARYGFYNDKVVLQFSVATIVWGIVGHGRGRADRGAAVLARPSAREFPGSVTVGCGHCTPMR